MSFPRIAMGAKVQSFSHKIMIPCAFCKKNIYCHLQIATGEKYFLDDLDPERITPCLWFSRSDVVQYSFNGNQTSNILIHIDCCKKYNFDPNLHSLLFNKLKKLNREIVELGECDLKIGQYELKSDTSKELLRELYPKFDQIRLEEVNKRDIEIRETIKEMANHHQEFINLILKKK